MTIIQSSICKSIWISVPLIQRNFKMFLTEISKIISFFVLRCYHGLLGREEAERVLQIGFKEKENYSPFLIRDSYTQPGELIVSCMFVNNSDFSKKFHHCYVNFQVRVLFYISTQNVCSLESTQSKQSVSSIKWLLDKCILFVVTIID